MAAVGVILGSDSDLPKVRECFEIMDQFSVDYDVIVSSAHRSAEQTVEWVKNASNSGIKVIIAVAGGARRICRVLSLPIQYCR